MVAAGWVGRPTSSATSISPSHHLPSASCPAQWCGDPTYGWTDDTPWANACQPMGMRLLLGVDEGTTAVKAALFDERLRPVREARRDKVNRHPQPGWVEQDGEEVLPGGG